ncbi:MAG: DUF389 domain-containing protein [Candidatus Magasanikbacteria bacterium]
MNQNQEKEDTKTMKGLFTIGKFDQYRTVEELIKRSKSDGFYYTLLVLSSLIVAAGLLLSNAPIVMGGMIVTPLITPILLVSLGISIGDFKLIKRVSLFLGKSIIVIAGVSFLVGVLFGKTGNDPTDLFSLADNLNGAALYFLVALVSGFVAAFTWTRKGLSRIMPGIAIAVALIPPLSLIGVGFSFFDVEMIRSNFLLFFFNLIGITLGATLVFSLFRFHEVEEKVEREVENQKEEEVIEESE